MVTFEPPRLTGNEAAQLTQLKSYLFQLSEKLNVALSNLDENNFAQTSTARAIVSGGVGSGVTSAVADTASALKSLIIKTADTVQSEIDAIELALQSDYVAESEFGTYKEDISTIITATAASLTQEINYGATITAVNDALAVLEEYRVETVGYIRSGIVYYDGLVPIVGIAIGQELTTTGSTETVDGKVYDILVKNQFSSVFTASKLSFFQGETEVAYLSNEKLYITNATITNKLAMGANWEISHTSGFSVKWTGA